MIKFVQRDSEGEIKSTISIDERNFELNTLKDVLEYWWNHIPLGYQLEESKYNV